jgi:hypothetical protein
LVEKALPISSSDDAKVVIGVEFDRFGWTRARERR